MVILPLFTCSASVLIAFSSVGTAGPRWLIGVSIISTVVLCNALRCFAPFARLALANVMILDLAASSQICCNVIPGAATTRAVGCGNVLTGLLLLKPKRESTIRRFAILDRSTLSFRTIFKEQRQY